MNTRTAVRADLTRDAIVDRALSIADVEGSDAITIRRLAHEFDVTPMALYWHVKNKDELLAAMGDRFYQELAPLGNSGPWSDRLRAVMSALVQSLRNHPGSAHLAAHRVLANEAGQELTEATLAMLRDAGFSVIQASDIARSALQSAVMLVTQMAGAEVALAADERDAAMRAKRDMITTLPAERFPNLIACVDALTDCEDEDGYYDFGVDLFLAGVERLNAATKRQNRQA
ncbi:MAG: TetR/AcrR family transcriptional regulator C-terminal domain-containing protein [Jatrophihabitantaceae bacterium]